MSVVSVEMLLVLEPFVTRYLYQEFGDEDIRHVRLSAANDGLRLRAELVFWDGTIVAAQFWPPNEPHKFNGRDVHHIARALRRVLFDYDRADCPACDGAGATIQEAGATVCPTCAGRGVILARPAGQ